MAPKDAAGKSKADAEQPACTILCWLKDTHLISAALEAAEKTRTLFEECLDQGRVDTDKYAKVIEEMVVEQERNMGALQHHAAEQAPAFVATYSAADDVIKSSWKQSAG